MHVYPTTGATRASGAAALSPGVANAAGRMSGIDAARGIAMVLVCVSHVRYHFVENLPAVYSALTNITRLATPTFLLLSGFVAAYVLSSNKRETRVALIDRGLFVLFAGHLLLNWVDLSRVGFEEWMFARITVTDAIAACLVIAALSSRLPAVALATIGAALALISWPIAMLWVPESPYARYAAIMLFNVHSEGGALTDAALVPYLGLFMIGMSLSRWCSSQLLARDFAAAARKLLVVGTIAVAFVLAAILVWHTLKPMLLEQIDESTLALSQLTLDPRAKMPPSPAYLMFYGGGGLIVAAICLICRPAALLRPIVAWASTLGRASLMCFVVQDWLLVLLPALLGLAHMQSVPFWIAYLLSALIVLHALAARWDRARANRFLTVGLKQSYAARYAKTSFAPVVRSRAEESRPTPPR